jgi:CMP-N,N'-diacetyllegionaminic acid synthase
VLRNTPVLAVIPVRSGSKGIAGKNLVEIGGLTLLERTIQYALACPGVDAVQVTTDCPKMYAVAERYGVAAPSLRPRHLAVDDARTSDVIAEHVLAESPLGQSCYVLLLQVTSPLRTLADAKRIFAMMEEDKSATGLIAVCTCQDHPLKSLKLDQSRLRPYFDVQPFAPRQSFPKAVHSNGAFYLTDSELLLRTRSFIDASTIAYEMPRERSINLDHPIDLKILEALVETGRVRLEDLSAFHG